MGLQVEENVMAGEIHRNIRQDQMLIRGGEVHLRALYYFCGHLVWRMEILCKALQEFVAKSSCQFAIAHAVCILLCSNKQDWEANNEN